MLHMCMVGRGGCSSTVTTRTFGQCMPDKDNFGAVIQNGRNDILRGEHAQVSADFADLERRPREQSDRHGGVLVVKLDEREANGIDCYRTLPRGDSEGD